MHTRRSLTTQKFARLDLVVSSKTRKQRPWIESRDGRHDKVMTNEAETGRSNIQQESFGAADLPVPELCHGLIGPSTPRSSKCVRSPAANSTT
jgi:hypothetical protein